MLKSYQFKCFALSGAHTLLDRSLRLLQLPLHLSKLTTSGQ